MTTTFPEPTGPTTLYYRLPTGAVGWVNGGTEEDLEPYVPDDAKRITADAFRDVMQQLADAEEELEAAAAAAADAAELERAKRAEAELQHKLAAARRLMLPPLKLSAAEAGAIAGVDPELLPPVKPGKLPTDPED